MRHDDSTAQRVNRILDQARRSGHPEDADGPDPVAGDDVWPQEWPPGSGPDPGPGPTRPWLGAGPRWQIPAPAAAAAGVLALLVVGLAAVLLLRGPAPGTPVPARASGAFGAVVTDPALTSPTAGPVEATGAVAAAGSAAPGSEAAGSGAAGSGASGSGASGSGAAGQFRVYVVGQVRNPGVVTLAAGARVEDAVQAVGGATETADLAVMNLARRVVDGERIVVPKPGEKIPTADPGPDPAGAGAAGSGGAGADAGSGGAGAVPGTPIDLNTATVAQLDALPGVGPVIAGRIVAWRQENGRFTTVDDLSEVQGIGDATMARLRPMVRV